MTTIPPEVEAKLREIASRYFSHAMLDNGQTVATEAYTLASDRIAELEAQLADARRDVEHYKMLRDSEYRQAEELHGRLTTHRERAARVVAVWERVEAASPKLCKDSDCGCGWVGLRAAIAALGGDHAK